MVRVSLLAENLLLYGLSGMHAVIVVSIVRVGWLVSEKLDSTYSL